MHNDKEYKKRGKDNEQYAGNNRVEDPLCDFSPANEWCLTNGNHWVAKKNIDGVFAGIKFWLARDEVVLDMVNLCGTKHFLILFLVFVEIGLDNGVDLELLDLRQGRVE